MEKKACQSPHIYPDKKESKLNTGKRREGNEGKGRKRQGDPF